MLSAEQNDSQSEEINVIDESQAENIPVPVQEAEIRRKKFLWSESFFRVKWSEKWIIRSVASLYFV